MTIAIVKDGQFLHTKPEEMVRDSNGVMRMRCVDISEGWYEFIPARNEASPTQKAQGTVFTVGNGTVTESFLYVDKTVEEIKTETNSKLDAQIDSLERQQLLPRITRDMHVMVTLQAATAQGLTEANLLDELHPAYSPGYARFKAFDSEVASLRSQRI